MKALITFKIIILFGLVFNSGCASNNSHETVKLLKYDHLLYEKQFPDFESYTIESEEEVFALDSQMQQFVDTKLKTEKNYKRRAKKLLRHIFSKDDINLAYQNDANLTASQAYHSKSANCMSLTIMAYTLANEGGLSVKFQSIKVPEYWIRNGEYNMLTGHVNLVVTNKTAPNQLIVYGKELMQIDFDPSIYKRSFPKNTISKKDMLSMFYNNKGAEALVAKDYDKAFAYFKHSIESNPSFSAVWGNLGILYKLKGQFELARATYNHAILLDGDNLTAYRNLSRVLTIFNEMEQVDEIEKMLHNKRYSNPYYQALLADEAFFRGDNKLAIQLYKKAIRGERTAHEFHFGLAKVYFAINDHSKAEKSMRKALAYNKYSSTESQYIAKLNFIRKHNE